MIVNDLFLIFLPLFLLGVWLLFGFLIVSYAFLAEFPKVGLGDFAYYRHTLKMPIAEIITKSVKWKVYNSLRFGRKRSLNDLHYKLLTQLAQNKRLILEFGVRSGNSTVALLKGNPETLISVDIANPVLSSSNRKYIAGVFEKWEFIKGDDLKVGLPSRPNLVYIDTSHLYLHTLKELERCRLLDAGQIALDDIIACKEVSLAIEAFLYRHPGEYEFKKYETLSGLGVLTRI